MFGFLSSLFESDEIEDDGQESSPASRAVSATIEVTKEAFENASIVAAALVNDDLEELRK